MLKDWKLICESVGYNYVKEDKTNIWFDFDGFEFRQTKGRFPPKKLNIKNCTTPEAWIVYLMHNKHNGRYGYDKFEWTGSVADSAEFYCEEHGYFNQEINGHLRGNGCYSCNGTPRLTLDVVKQRCVATRGNEFDYSNIAYEHTKNMITITCKQHGSFDVNLYAHLRGVSCFKCYEDNRPKTRSNSDEFTSKAVKVHGDKYDYSLVDYKCAKTPVNIICKEHGVFQQVPNYHLSGNGCQYCAKELTGFNRTSYKKACADGSNIYLFKIYNTDECFYKIGISKNFLNRSSQITCEAGYTCEVLYTQFFSDPEVVYDLENVLHKEFKEVSYTPKIRFSGSTECFSNIDVDEFKKIIMCIA